MRRQRPRGILRRGVSNTLIVFKSIVVGRMQLNIFAKLGVVPKTTVKMDDLFHKTKNEIDHFDLCPKWGANQKTVV